MMRSLNLLRLVVLLLILGPVTSFAGRLLVEQPAYRVELEHEVHCGAPVTVDVLSRDASLFAEISNERQRLLDGLRAMLGYECPALQEIHLRGRYPDEPVWQYQGLARAGNDWLVQNIAYAGDPAGAFEQGSPTAPANGSPRSGTGNLADMSGRTLSDSGAYSVLGLRLGMPLTQARWLLRGRFAAEPQYDPVTRVLQVQAGGCPQAFDWRTGGSEVRSGWQCLRASFSTDQTPSLESVEFVQTTAAAQQAQAMLALQERYGRYYRLNVVPSEDPGSVPLTRIVWGNSPIPAGASEVDSMPGPELQADISTVDSATIVALLLRDAGIQAQSGGAQTALRF